MRIYSMEYQEYYRQQMQYLNQIIEKSQVILANAPEGTLRISRSNHSTQYYWKNSETNNYGKYIRRSDEGLASALASKEYASMVLPLAIKTKEELHKCRDLLELESIKQVYESLLVHEKKLVKPFILEDDAYALEWKEQKLQYHQPMPYKIETGITTEMGELVRSKSEKIIADKLAMMGIPYIYETPLYLDGYGTIYPDFTVFNKRTKQEFFWEHFGMMDSPEYSEKAIKKIETYERNGFYYGKNLITTFETKYHIPDMNVLEKKIKAFLM